jgi:hypothetical protein
MVVSWHIVLACFGQLLTLLEVLMTPLVCYPQVATSDTYLRQTCKSNKTAPEHITLTSATVSSSISQTQLVLISMLIESGRSQLKIQTQLKVTPTMTAKDEQTYR